MSVDFAERAVREGDLASALDHLQAAVRAQPASLALRVFLFQLLAVNGEWDRAHTQLNVAAELDEGALAMAQMYRETIACERLRAEVFAGRRSPVVFGEPDEWVALLIESLMAAGRGGDSAQVEDLRAQAFEGAPASAGSIDDKPFTWIADADMRLGPMCEAIINGRYFWVPFTRIAGIDLEAPTDLRDLVWMPAQFHFVNGGEAVGVIPTRYVGSEAESDSLIRLARKTAWNEVVPGVFTGLGQRMLTTDGGDHPLMDVRSIRLDVDGTTAYEQGA